MNHSSRLSARLVLLLILCSSLSLYAQTDPRAWDPDAIAVRQGTHLEWQQATAMNEQGQTCVVWSDTRTGTRAIYMQIINADGSLLLEDQGQLVARSELLCVHPVVASVNGGWIVAWLSHVAWAGEGLYLARCVSAQSIDVNGTLQWSTEGVEVYYNPDTVVGESSLRIAHDENGGVILAWEESGIYHDISAAHLTAAGLLDWETILHVTDMHSVQSGLDAVADRQGNMFIAWNDWRNLSSQDIYGAKIMADGTLPWGDGVNGIPICTAAMSQNSPKVCPDLTTGGCYCAWIDESLLGDRNLYAQRISGTGTPLWQQDGIILCNAPHDQSGIYLAANMTGENQAGFVCCWEDTRVNGIVKEVFAQKVAPEGVALWGENGTLVCGDAGPGEFGNARDGSRIVSDIAGGAVISWDDTRHAVNNPLQYDLYASRLNENGTNLWSECGELIASGDFAQAYAAITIRESSSLAEIVFTDGSATGSPDLKHQRFALDDGAVLLETPHNLLSCIEGNVEYIQAIGMSGNRAAIVWADSRGEAAGQAIYYQIVNAAGTFELPRYGSVIAPDNTGYDVYYQSHPVLASDGSGGFYAAFVDLRTGVKQIRLSRINSVGEITSDPAGVIVHEADFDQSNVLLCPDGSGGCYVAWSESDVNFILDVYVQRFNVICEPIWATPVRLTDDEACDDVIKGLVAGSDGRCFVIWESNSWSQRDILGARICWDGTVDWQDAVCDATGHQANPYAIPDHSGGIYITWEDKRVAGNNNDIYIQHLDVSGRTAWVDNGIIVIALELRQENPKLIVTDDDNIYVVWEDFRNGHDIDLYAQRIDAAGNLLWDESGLLICGELYDQFSASFLPNNSGGFLAVWQDARNEYSDIYGINLLPNGLPTDNWWIAGNGGIVCELNESQCQPVIAPLGDQQTLVAWIDHRAQADFLDFDLYMQSLNISTVTSVGHPPTANPNACSLNQNYPNPFNPATTISFTIPQAGQTSLVIYDLLGRTVQTLMNSPLAAGDYHIQWNAEALPSGVYFYRLTSGEFTDVKKTVLLK